MAKYTNNDEDLEDETHFQKFVTDRNNTKIINSTMDEYLNNDGDLKEGKHSQEYSHGRRENNKIFPQFMAGVTANITAAITGCVIGWTSPSLVILEGPDSPIPITKEQNSWISSLMPLAASLGPFAAGYLAQKCGRKKALLLSAVPAFCSWISLALAKSVEVMYAARFVAGFTVGWIFTVLPMYCGEISDKNVRGAIGSLMQIFIVFGLLFDYCIGPYVPLMWLSIGASFIPLAFVMLFLWMPESPYYLLHIEDKENAAKSLQRLRGKSLEGISYELSDIQANVEKAKCETGSFKDLFATKGTTKAFIISLGLVGFQQLSGINVVLFFTQTIFEKTGGTFKAEISTIITGVIMLLASCVTPLFVDKAGRKILLLTSAIGMALAHVVLGLCFFLEKNGTDMSSYNFLSIVAVVAYIIVYCLGFGPLPWAVMGEMFPGNIKPLASTLTASFCWILGFFVTRFFNDIVSTVGNDYTFWMFGMFCILAMLFVYFVLPETKGKTFTEIQEILSRTNS